MRKDRIILAVTLVILVSVFIAPAVSPSPDGLSGECESCHKSFDAFQTTIEAPSEVPANTDFEYKVTVRNTWEHTVVDLFATLDLSECPEIELIGEAPEPEEFSFSGTVTLLDSSGSHSFNVDEGATAVTVTLTGDAGILGLNDLDLTVSGAEGGTWSSTQGTVNEEISLGTEELNDGGKGSYSVTATLANGGTSSYSISITVSYAGGGTQMGPNLKEGESHTFTWNLRSAAKASNLAKLTVTGTAYQEHIEDTEDGKEIVDADTYTFDHESRIVVGDKFVNSIFQTESTFEALWLSGRVLGFVTAGFFVISMVLSRASGPICKAIRKKCSKQTLDRWHCFVSVGMFVSIMVHFIVLYQGPYAGTTVGQPTGITATAAVVGLVGLGVWKQLFVSRFGMKNWRNAHIILAFTVLLVAVLHMLLNGSSFEWWRELA